jgi:hypothetical protein
MGCSEQVFELKLYLEQHSFLLHFGSEKIDHVQLQAQSNINDNAELPWT